MTRELNIYHWLKPPKIDYKMEPVMWFVMEIIESAMLMISEESSQASN